MNSDKLNIFIIDDNRLFALTLRAEVEKSLKGREFEIFLFENGEACRSKLFLNPQLVLVDYHLDSMKENAMNGLEVIEMIRNESPDSDFIMITMDEQTELFLRSKEYQIYDYITKSSHLPFKLSLAIQHWLKMKGV